MWSLSITQLSYCGLKAATDYIQLDENGFVPIKLCENRLWVRFGTSAVFCPPCMDGLERVRKVEVEFELSGTKTHAHPLQFL